jgi:hypothetical protein
MGLHINQLPQSVKDKLGLKDTAYKQFWAVIADKKPIYFRSSWEYYYGIFLQKLKQEGKILDWEHEPQCFWFDNIKRGTRSYLPDFRITHLNNSIEYVETKGYLDSKSQTKMKRMAIYYPEVNIRLVDKLWFKQNIKACKALEPLFVKKNN